MNWNTFEDEMTALSVKITGKYDIIVGITRGGLVPARMLSTSLGVKKMHCVSVLKKDGERSVVTEINENLSGKSILLVEDMLETGRGLQSVQAYLESKGAQTKTACLYTMPISEFTPDFSLREVEEVVGFPWE